MRQRGTAASTDDLRRAMETAMRAAAIDTGAIEGLYDVDRGFTFSVARQTAAWQALVNKKGPYVRDLFEAQLRAYELALDAATGRLPITEAWIRRLHEVVSQPQETVRVLTDLGWQEQQFTRGRYKAHPNHVRLPDGQVQSYAPVAETPAEMHRLVEQLARPEFAPAHPSCRPPTSITAWSPSIRSRTATVGWPGRSRPSTCTAPPRSRC
jgi:Fic family protein